VYLALPTYDTEFVALAVSSDVFETVASETRPRPGSNFETETFP